MQTQGILYKYYHLYFVFVFLKGVFGEICIMTWPLELCGPFKNKELALEAQSAVLEFKCVKGGGWLLGA